MTKLLGLVRVIDNDANAGALGERARVDVVPAELADDSMPWGAMALATRRTA